jgi:cysteine desulfurase
MIYLDYNATTPIDPRVAEVMLPFIHEHYGNPSSPHALGRLTRKAVDQARKQVAGLLGCAPGEVVFTSGGTESNNMALKGAAAARLEHGNHIVISAVEHPAVTEVCDWLADNGFRITVVPVDDTGMVSPDDVAAAMRQETTLVSIMHAQNEVGTLQPIAQIAKVAHSGNALMHTDAAQSAGKVPIDVNRLDVDLLSLAGHKLYGPKGVGALYVRDGVRLEKFMHGASHENGRRAGTENVILVAGLGLAAELAAADVKEELPRLSALRDKLEAVLVKYCGPTVPHGNQDSRLPNTCSVGFPGLLSSAIIAQLDDVCCSAGSACNADGIHTSPVLSAMGVPLDVAAGTLRFSVGRFTTEKEIDCVAKIIIQAIAELRTHV